MPDKPIRKGFDILEAAEEIRQSQPPLQPNNMPSKITQKYITDIRRISLSIGMPKYTTFDVWRELLAKTRNFPKPEFRDDISELRQEVDTLKLMVKSLTKTIESSNRTIDELSKEIRQKQTIRQTGETSVDKLCNAYVKMVSKIDIVKEIYVILTNNVLTCWTIIDAEPFDSALLEPIYDAQVEIYREKKDDLALDFHVLNLSELHDRQELESILSPSAKLVWQR